MEKVSKKIPIDILPGFSGNISAWSPRMQEPAKRNATSVEKHRQIDDDDDEEAE